MSVRPCRAVPHGRAALSLKPLDHPDHDHRAKHGTDEARDVWTAFGNLDTLEGLLVNSFKLNLDSGGSYRTNEELQYLWNLATTEGATVLGIEETYPIESGTPADIVVHDARSPQWTIIESPDPRYIIKDGQIVAHHEPRDVSVGVR